MTNELAKYEADNGQQIVLTSEDVRNVISNDPNVTDKEVRLFVELCKAQRLNPFIKEAYLTKYGNNPATMVVGKDVHVKRAARNPLFKGFEAGVTVAANGKLLRREGSMVLPGEQLIGGWCRVHVEGYAVPVYDEVSLEEYAGRKRDGSFNSQWATKGGTMIRKVALVHALREAFPEDLEGMYSAEEMDGGDAMQAQHQEPQHVQAVAEVVEPARPPRLETLRQLFKEAKEVGILLRDPNDDNAGLLGWIHAKYGCEPDELGNDQIAECEAHARQVIADKKSMSAPQPEPEPEPVYEAVYEADLADNDIPF